MNTKEIEILQIDAFSSRAFSGNPAGVCILNDDDPILSAPEGDLGVWMQSVAMEMNLSETAFLIRENEGFRLRWFTPTLEVDLCGHATLAAAHFLYSKDLVKRDTEIKFYSRSGVLSATQSEGWIWLDFPAEPAVETPQVMGLSEILEIPILYAGKNRMDYIFEIESEETLRVLKPDLRLLEGLDARGVIITARAKSESEGYDFVSRFFAPRAGIVEDPVTGSAHCCLAPHWAHRLKRQELTGYQASRRGGIVRVKNRGDRVILGGQALTVMKIHLLPLS